MLSCRGMTRRRMCSIAALALAHLGGADAAASGASKDPCYHPNLFLLRESECLKGKMVEFGVCFVVVIFVTLLLEKILDALETWAERSDGALSVGATLVKELTILGFVAFSATILLQVDA